MEWDSLKDGLCWVWLTLVRPPACQHSWEEPRLKLNGLNLGLLGSRSNKLGLGLAWLGCSATGLNKGLVRICLSLGLALVRVRLAWPITIPLLPCSTGLTLGMFPTSPGLSSCFTGLRLGLAISTGLKLGLVNSAGR